MIRDAWVRAAQAGGTSAAYLTLTNGRVAPDDALVGVSAPDLTDSASLHETTSDASGMTGMPHMESIAIPAGGTVALEPGGYHVMLMGLKQRPQGGRPRPARPDASSRRASITVDAQVRAS